MRDIPSAFEEQNQYINRREEDSDNKKKKKFHIILQRQNNNSKPSGLSFRSNLMHEAVILTIYEAGLQLAAQRQ